MPRSVDEWIGRNDNAMPGKLVRDRLSARQGDCCAECRQPFGLKRRAHCDHIVALIDGGENRETNLQMLCAICHERKTSAEATVRAKVRDIRANNLLARPPSRLRGQSFRKAPPQHKATSPLSDKFALLRKEPT